MRLLIYLLALMTGFSAAEAARPVAATPASVTQQAVVLVSADAVDQSLSMATLDHGPNLATDPVPYADLLLLVSADSPVSRHDLSHQ